MEPHSNAVHPTDILSVNTDFMRHLEGLLNTKFTHVVGSVGGGETCNIPVGVGLKHLTIEQALSKVQGATVYYLICQVGC